ncbi:HdeD family acid-resistance protein [Halorarius litoreus]|uniref:HdeD family acid-resistance protein n=1 Tax=Halorarius litoreus TaxID=2962676 RepID=UPI0020CD6465|nr:DUF308 domain-containing protein [Halorarius litoreus]
MSYTTDYDTSQTDSRVPIIGGAIIAVLGLLAMVFPFVTGVSLSLLLGGVLVVGALVHVAHAFSPESFWGAVWQVVLAIVYGFAGISLLANPVIGLTTLTLLAIAYLLVNGVVMVGWSLVGRGNDGWIWLLASGVLSVLLAGGLLIGFPSTALWAVGLLFGVNLLVTGVTLVMIGMRARRSTTERVVAGEGQQGV